MDLVQKSRKCIFRPGDFDAFRKDRNENFTACTRLDKTEKDYYYTQEYMEKPVDTMGESGSRR
jgi:hypothetical protein